MGPVAVPGQWCSEGSGKLRFTRFGSRKGYMSHWTFVSQSIIVVLSHNSILPFSFAVKRLLGYCSSLVSSGPDPVIVTRLGAELVTSRSTSCDAARTFLSLRSNRCDHSPSVCFRRCPPVASRLPSFLDQTIHIHVGRRHPHMW